MLKRALMLTAATAALLAAPALADELDITNEVTTPLKTSTALNGGPADIVIETSGSVVVTTGGPAIEIDSPNFVSNSGTISNKNTDLAVGVQLDATASGNGPGQGVTALDNIGTIDLSGSGNGKTGILVTDTSGATAGTFNGDIILESTSKLVVEGGTTTGDNPVTTEAIHVAENTTLNGKIDVSGTIQMTDTAANKTGVLIGTPAATTPTVVNGDIIFESGSTLTMVGDSSTAVHIAENATLNGNLDLDATFDLTGAGNSKTGVLIGTLSATTGAVINGDFTLDSAGSLKIAGGSGNSYGILLAQNSVLNGNLDIEGLLNVQPITATETDGLWTGVLVQANPNGQAITGDVTVGTDAKVTVSGALSQAMILSGDIGGSFTNKGTISATGTFSPNFDGKDPEAASALIINGGIGGGILNDGPVSVTDTTARASITESGTTAAILIQNNNSDQNAQDIHIGVYNDTEGGLTDMSFINRGQITAAPIDADLSLPAAIQILGNTSTERVVFDGGFYNSGTVTATVASNSTGDPAGYQTRAIWIGSYAVVPSLTNSNQGGTGAITARLAGPMGGEADGILISTNGFLGSITNSGTISAVAGTTDTTISDLAAYAIVDRSGTLNFIDNSGTILAFATTLDDGSQIAHAVDLSASTQNITFINTGTVTGDVLFGNGADSLMLSGTSLAPATVTGNVEFGGTAGAGDDVLDIGDYSTVSGAVTDRAGGRLDVDVHGGGTLNLSNDSVDLDKRFTANNFTIDAGGTLGLTLNQVYNVTINPTAGGIVTTTGAAILDPQANINLNFSSFVTATSPGEASQFILIDAPLNQLSLDLQALDSQICPNVPFLFKSDNSQCLTQVNDTANGRSELELTLTPKTAQDLDLHGYALKMFNYANQALATDDTLGAAVIEAGLPVNGIPLTTEQGNALYQDIYSQFAPNVTGASRTLAIALTDQATGPVAERQRALRMYAAQPGDITFWSQEFAVNLNQDANIGTIGYKDSGFGLAMGADGGDPADGRYGGALSFYSGNINEKEPRTSNTSTVWWMATGYSDWRGRGFFLDTQLTAGVGQLDGKRLLQFQIPQSDGSTQTFTRLAEGKRDALLGAGGFTTGVILTSGSTVFTPELSVDGLAMREDKYHETGGPGFGLDVQPVYYQSVRAFLGADLRQDINLGDFYLQPAARAGYRYDFLANPEKVHAAFEGTGVPFSLTGPDPTQGTAVAGASLSATTSAWSLGLNYEYLRGNDGSVSQEGTLTLIGRI